MTITAEDWVRRIEEVLDKFNLSKEEYWKDPEKLEPFYGGQEKCVNNTIL